MARGRSLVNGITRKEGGKETSWLVDTLVSIGPRKEGAFHMMAKIDKTQILLFARLLHTLCRTRIAIVVAEATFSLGLTYQR